MCAMRVYVDGVFDLFHVGHLAFLRKARELGAHEAAAGEAVTLVAGVITDDDARWKRRPVIPHGERVEMVRNCRLVDSVLVEPPLKLTEEFLDEFGIDLAVHGDDSEQAEFFVGPIRRGIMRYVPYHAGRSTSAIIADVKKREDL